MIRDVYIDDDGAVQMFVPVRVPSRGRQTSDDESRDRFQLAGLTSGAPYGTDEQGHPLAPYGVTADGRPYLSNSDGWEVLRLRDRYGTPR